MKVKVITRAKSAVVRETRDDVVPVHRNLDPKLHPFERAREYRRALNAAKMDRMFAKPFVAAMDGHSDGVCALASSPTSLVAFLSGACDGEVKVWDLPHRRCLWSVNAHEGFVRGLSVDGTGSTFVSCGDDKVVKQWKLGASAAEASAGATGGLTGGGGLGIVDEASDDGSDGGGEGDEEAFDSLFAVGGGGFGGDGASVDTAGSDVEVEPLNTWTGKSAFRGIDHHWSEPMFATASTELDVWDHSRSIPVHSFAWGADTVTTVRFNPADRDILASAASDRNVALYDLRMKSPLRKVVLEMRTNSMCWNPREPMNFTVANEDHNCYTFDMRKLDRALMVHKGHVSAVMDVSYSPTGREFCTGAYDRTVRIFPVREGKSREVYHTRRMQRVFAVQFSADANFVISGSDDTNVRVWKAKASQKLGKMKPRERAAKDYRNSLVKRYKHLPEVGRITRSRRLPNVISKAVKRKHEDTQKEKRKSRNIRLHTDPEKHEKPKAERKKHVVRELQ